MEESLEAPARVSALLDAEPDGLGTLIEGLRRAPPPFAVTVARGSSDHAAGYAAYLLAMTTGCVAASLPPSLAGLERAPLRLQGAFALAVSQSGRSPDIVAALEAADRAGATTVALVNDTGSPLAAAARHLLDQGAGPERSVAATKSVICTMTALARLVARWADDRALLDGLQRLPVALAAAAQADAPALPVTADTPMFVVGRGLGLPAAQEVALKLKETCGLQAEAFSSAEVRHGPREVVDGRYLVLALALPGPGEADVRAAAAELGAQGAKVLVIDADPEVTELPDRRLAPILALQMLFPVIARTAEALGRDPDRPRTLEKVTLTR